MTTTGASVLTDVPALEHSVAMWRQFSQWLGGMGIIVLALAVLPRLRVGGRQLFESEAPGPEAELLATSMRETARRLWLLSRRAHRPHGRRLGDARLDRRRPHHELLRRRRPRLYDASDRRLLDPRALDRGVRGGDAVGRRFLHGRGWSQLRPHVPRSHPPEWPRPRPRRGASRLPPCPPRHRDRPFPEARGPRDLRRGGGRAACGLPGRVDHDHDGLRQRRLQPVADLRRHDPRGAHVHRRSAGSTAGAIKVVRLLMLARLLRRELDQTVHAEAVVPVRFNGAVVSERTVRAVAAFILFYFAVFLVGTLGLVGAEAIGPPARTSAGPRPSRPRPPRSETSVPVSRSSGRWAPSSPSRQPPRRS